MKAKLYPTAQMNREHAKKVKRGLVSRWEPQVLSDMRAEIYQAVLRWMQ